MSRSSNCERIQVLNMTKNSNFLEAARICVIHNNTRNLMVVHLRKILEYEMISRRWGWPDGQTLRESCLAISVHLSQEGRGPHHHVETGKRWCKIWASPERHLWHYFFHFLPRFQTLGRGPTFGSPWSCSTTSCLRRGRVAPPYLSMTWPSLRHCWYKSVIFVIKRKPKNYDFLAPTTLALSQHCPDSFEKNYINRTKIWA